MPRRVNPVVAMDLEPGDTVTVGPNTVLMAEGTVGTFLFYSECGPPIVEVADRGRFLVPERSLTRHERPPAAEPEPDPVPYVPDPTLPAELSDQQSDRLLAHMAERNHRGATPSPTIPPMRRTAIMPLAWEVRTDASEPAMPLQIGKAQWDASGIAAWVDRLEPQDDLETVALHELRRAVRETRYWLEQLGMAREMVTA